MKVAIEIQPVLEQYLTGVGWYTENLVTRLKTQAPIKDEVFLLGMDFFKNADRLEKAQTPNIRIRTNGLMHYGIYRRLWHLMPFLDYGKFFGVEADIYHFMNFVVPPYVKGKVVVTVYDLVYKLFPETMEKANLKKLEANLTRSMNRADLVLTISENSKQEIIHYLGVPEEKIRILYPGVDEHLFFPVTDGKRLHDVRGRYGLPDVYFLYLGTLEPRKNIETIIEAYRLYHEKNPEGAALVIAGKKGWMYERMFEQVQRDGLAHKVIFPGYVDELDKPSLYSGACAFLFPSLYEGFGMPPLEAMACGTPVIAAATSSLPEVVGSAGCLVDPMDTETIAAHMKMLTKDHEVADYYQREGLKRAKVFSWDKSVEGLYAMYRELMS